MRGKNKPKVCYPLDIPKANLDLWGYHIEESNYYNIVACDSGAPFIKSMGGLKPYRIGRMLENAPLNDEFIEGLVGYYEGESIVFRVNNQPCELEPYRLKMDIFSRNTGILESDIMLKKGAIIIGCGSVGSLVALELARAGVGRFFLVDSDIFGYHNICRHQCGIQDVGKYKTTAVKERILQINPTATVQTSSKLIQEVSLDMLSPFCNPDTIIVGCADNREGDLYADTFFGKTL